MRIVVIIGGCILIATAILGAIASTTGIPFLVLAINSLWPFIVIWVMCFITFLIGVLLVRLGVRV